MIAAERGNKREEEAMIIFLVTAYVGERQVQRRDENVYKKKGGVFVLIVVPRIGPFLLAAAARQQHHPGATHLASLAANPHVL